MLKFNELEPGMRVSIAATILNPTETAEVVCRGAIYTEEIRSLRSVTLGWPSGLYTTYDQEYWNKYNAERATEVDSPATSTENSAPSCTCDIIHLWNSGHADGCPDKEEG